MHTHTRTHAHTHAHAHTTDTITTPPTVTPKRTYTFTDPLPSHFLMIPYPETRVVDCDVLHALLSQFLMILCLETQVDYDVL